MRITESQAQVFAREGYLILPDVLSPEALARMRHEADAAVSWQEARIAAGAFVDTINHPGEHYFVPQRSRERAVVLEHTRLPIMVEICRALLGPDAYLFTELFVCKMPGCELDFGWHQDSGYLHAFGFDQYPPNISVWTALDRMDDDNGALWVRPPSRGGPSSVQPHKPDVHNHQIMAMDAGEDILIDVDAGTLVVFAGTLAHRSGPNRSTRSRRAHLLQFGSQPILLDGRPVQLADPLLVGGQLATAPESSG